MLLMKKLKKNTQNELYPIINIRDSNNKKKPIKTIYDELKNNLSKYKKKNNKEYCWLKLSLSKINLLVVIIYLSQKCLQNGVVILLNGVNH